MTAKDVYDKLIRFIDNDFAHHVAQQDKDVGGLRKIMFGLLITSIAGLLGIIGGLIYLVIGK